MSIMASRYSWNRLVIQLRVTSTMTVSSQRRHLTSSFPKRPRLFQVPTVDCRHCRHLLIPQAVRKEESLSADSYLLLIIPLAAFGLGTWQIYRRRWKLGLIGALAENTTAEPIELPHDLRELGDLEYRRVCVTGTFDHNAEMYVGPRSLFIDGAEPTKSGGLISSSNSGYHVVTPFKLADRELTILVNRGWVPRKQTQPLTRKAGQVESEVEIIGIVRKSEKRAPFMLKNEKDTTFFHYRDIEAMAYKRNIAPVFLDADAGSTVPGGPQGGQTKVSLRNEHLSYIITWYSLAVATSYLWFRRYMKKRPLL